MNTNMNPLSLSAAAASLGQRQSIQSTIGTSMSINSIGNHANTMGFGNNLVMGNNSPPLTYNTGYSMVPPQSSGTDSVGSGGLAGNPQSPTLSSQALQCGLSDMEESWRGSSIAALRRKAIEHSVNISGYREGGLHL